MAAIEDLEGAFLRVLSRKRKSIHGLLHRIGQDHIARTNAAVGAFSVLSETAAFIMFDYSGRIFQVNRYAAHLFGLAPEDVLGTSMVEYYMPDQEYTGETFEEGVDRFLEQGWWIGRSIIKSRDNATICRLLTVSFHMEKENGEPIIGSWGLSIDGLQESLHKHDVEALREQYMKMVVSKRPGMEE